MLKAQPLLPAVLIFLLCLGTPHAVAAQDRVGTLVAVLSGDTIQVRYGGAPGMLGEHIVTLRLFGIRCPRPGDPFGDEARDVLGRFIGVELLIGNYVGDGSFGVDVALVGYPAGTARSLAPYRVDEELDYVYFQEELLKAGLAETDGVVCRGRDRADAILCEDWKALERQAREERKGMWGNFRQPVD